jgi:hypothetical protein
MPIVALLALAPKGLTRTVNFVPAEILRRRRARALFLGLRLERTGLQGV